MAVTPAITSVSFSLILLPLDSSGNAKELVFIEINGAKGYGYDESLETSKAYSLSGLKDAVSKRDICGIIRNDTGKSYALTDEMGRNIFSEQKIFIPFHQTNLKITDFTAVLR